MHPELIRVLPSLDAASAVAQPASAAPRDDALACLQAGPFTPAELDAALAALPAGAGSRVIDVRSERPPTWITPHEETRRLSRKIRSPPPHYP